MITRDWGTPSFPIDGPANRIRPAIRLRCILASVMLLAASCTPHEIPQARDVAAATPPTAAKPAAAPVSAETPAPQRSAGATVFAGTGVFVNPSTPRVTRVDVSGDGDVSFNFVNADVREVAREILGNQLHLTYAVDAKVQAAITAQTGGPVARAAVLPVLESVLRSNGLDLVETNGVYRIMALDDAAKGSLGASQGPDQPGYAVRIFPLHYVSASELKTVIEPFLPPGNVMSIDAARNLLIVSGPGGQEGLGTLIRQFDADWLAGTSFAVYPLHVGMAKDVANELDAIFGEGGNGALAGLVRIVPIPRLNAILVISPQRSYLTQVKTWIDRLDYGEDELTPRLFEYRVQNSRASDLAAVLTRLLSSGAVSTVRPEISAGSQSAAIMSQQATGAMSGRPGSGTGYGINQGALSGPLPGPGLSAGPAQIPPPSVGLQAPVGSARSPLPSAGGILGVGAVPGGADSALAAVRGESATALEMPQARVVADEKNNALVIYARPRDYKMIEDVIRRLDVVPLQVLLEATIAEVTLNDALNYGLQFFLKPGKNNNLEFTTSTPGGPGAPLTGTSGLDISPVFPGFNYVLNTTNARVILNLLSQITRVNVVSSPQLLVLDHQTAALQVGDQVPIITQSAVSVITPGAPVVNSVEYRSTGVVLLITPRVNSSGLITLDIDQEVSDVKPTTTSTINSPTIAQRRIISSVVVQDGQTVALGGLIQDREQRARSGVPLLSDIPVLGLLFSSTTNADTRTELLVLLSPKIIRNGQDAQDMTEDLRNRMRTVKPLEARVR
jgi:general secretion pathway protein D